jgi:hypothetical protein
MCLLPKEIDKTKLPSSIPNKFKTILFYHSDGGLHRGKMIKNATGDDDRFFSHPVDPQVSLYLHFYMTHCRKGSQRSKGIAPVFTNSQRGKWQKKPTIVRSIREYLIKTQASVELLDTLGINDGYRYHYYSRLMWVTIRSVKNNHANIENDLYSMGFGHQIVDSYKTTLQALQYVDLETLPRSIPMSSLSMLNAVPNDLLIVIGSEIMSICKNKPMYKP